MPIVVPRQKQYGEHVNDHQLEFARAVAERQGNIIVVENVEALGNVLQHYDEAVAGMNRGIRSNNRYFCEQIEKFAAELVEE